MKQEVSCLTPEAWDRVARGDVDTTTLEIHRSECPQCQRIHAELEAVGSVVRTLRQQRKLSSDDDIDVNALRQRVLKTVERRPPHHRGRAREREPEREPERERGHERERGRKRRVVVSVLAMVAIIGVVFFSRFGLLRQRSVVLLPAPTANNTSRGHVHPDDGARYATLGTTVGDEVVRLYAGLITVEVDKLSNGERYRVVTDDAEIEVRGTSFEVRADAGRLVSVRVFHGRVEVRPSGSSPQMLEPTETWTSTSTSSSTSMSSSAPPTTPPQPDRRTSTSPSPSAKTPTPTQAELAFQRAWSELRTGNATEAARLFAAVPKDSPLHEDALFWQGVALTRDNHPAEARRVFDQFRKQYPSSTRNSDIEQLLHDAAP